MEIGIRELRDGLSKHLAEVRQGRTVTVTDHGRPIARIVPVEQPSRLERLRAEGRVQSATKRKRPAPTRRGERNGQRPGGRPAPVIAYLDTSAVVPLLVAEPASAACRRFWDDADDVVSCRLTYVGAAAALAQANRTGRLDAAQHEQARTLLDALWVELDVVEVDDELVRSAAAAAYECGLRGPEAVQCVAAEQLLDDDLVAAAGDQRLLAAWHRRAFRSTTRRLSDSRARELGEPVRGRRE